MLPADLETQIREIAREEATMQADLETRQWRRSIDEQMEQVWRTIGRTTGQIEALTNAQKRTEQRVNELAEAQKRTEERLERLETTVHELAEAQKRTEERLERLETTVHELAEAQKRTEQTVQMLVESQQRLEQRMDHLETSHQQLQRTVNQMQDTLDRTQRHVGQLATRLGMELEVDAEEVLIYALKQRGYQLLGEPRSVLLDGEVDVALPLKDPTGQRLWALIEVKARARLKDLEKWSDQLQDTVFQKRLSQQGIEPPYLPYLFGLRVYEAVDQTAEAEGIGVLDSRQERVAARPFAPDAES